MSMVPSPSELQYFLEVASTSNISRAAERLGITQPTLSLAIQRIEKSLGVPLLVRNKSGVQLTHAGQRIRSQAQSLLLEWDRIKTETLREEFEMSGQYSIGCHPSVALYALPLFLPKLMEQNPRLEVKLVHDLSRKITEDVISFKLDFGIVVNPIRHPDIVIRELCSDLVELWVAPKPTPFQDPYSGEGILIADPDLAQSQSVLKQLVQTKLKFRRLISSSNLEVITELTHQGIGVGLLPGRVAARQRMLGLKPLLRKGPAIADSHCLVYRSDAQKSKASRAIAHLIETEMTRAKRKSRKRTPHSRHAD